MSGRGRLALLSSLQERVDTHSLISLWEGGYMWLSSPHGKVYTDGFHLHIELYTQLSVIPMQEGRHTAPVLRWE